LIKKNGVIQPSQPTASTRYPYIVTGITRLLFKTDIDRQKIVVLLWPETASAQFPSPAFTIDDRIA